MPGSMATSPPSTAPTTREFTDHYTEDIELVIASGKVLRGRQSIADFYRGVNAGTRRSINVIQVFGDDQNLAAELESEFLATTDVADFPSGPLRRGDRLYVRSFALYDLRGNKFCRIRAASFRRELRTAPPVASSNVNPASD